MGKINKVWYTRWYMIVIYTFFGIMLLSSFMVDSVIDNVVDYNDVEEQEVSQIQEVNNVEPLEKISSEPILKILDLSCKYGEYGWVYVKGRVENNGDREVKFVKINIDLFNEDDWVESGYTFIRNTDLPAGRTDSFEKTWTEDLTFTRCEAFIS